MLEYDTIVRGRQKAIRREIDRRGIAMKAVQLDAGWESPSTVLSYFPADANKEPATISGAAIYRLLETNALPAELLSMLLPPGFSIVRVPEELDLDEVEGLARDLLATKGAAHHPASENGREIGPNEHRALCDKTARLVAVAA